MSPDNTLDRQTALRLLTTGGYDLIRQSDAKGILKKGYVADVLILDQDYFEVSDDRIESITSMLTIVDGRIVWGAGEYSTLAPPKLPAIPDWSPVNFYGGYEAR